MLSSPKARFVVLAGMLLGLASIAIAADDPASARAAIGPDDLGFDEIVFVKRKPYSSDHYYPGVHWQDQPFV